ncbi:MAG: hypothetical protein HGA45_37030, partial [Chloroflexales bacterium]|nr:hypothetical protein [Chloroflexales bacterium]
LRGRVGRDRSQRRSGGPGLPADPVGRRLHRCTQAGTEVARHVARRGPARHPLRRHPHAGIDRLPQPRWRDEASVALGLVAQGYPHHFPIGAAIQGLSEVDPGVLVFHDQTHSPAGLRYTPAARGGGIGALLAGASPALGATTVTGGHVAAVVTLGATLAGARGRALLNAERISFPGRTYREDVGAHEFR